MLGILGGLLALLGLLLFFLSRRSQPRSPSLSPLPGEPARLILSASLLSRVEGKAWLLPALVGPVLLCAGLLAAQGTMRFRKLATCRLGASWGGLQG